ncbi:MAG: hypothetical protein GDA40_05635 [Rhodobacteraceae bacterium]|nr:hypothetical protein [Paracoccaceae bacterium]
MTANDFFVREAQTLEKPGHRRMADGDALGSSKRIAEIEERNVRVLHRRCAEDATMRGPFAGPQRPTHRRDRGCAVAPNLPPPSTARRDRYPQAPGGVSPGSPSTIGRAKRDRTSFGNGAGIT